ncbi:MAG: DMT family transporter [Bradymonadaceae bacterium]|nr:DMT family transporter [Lujinxingiaceae bacterium]
MAVRPPPKAELTLRRALFAYGLLVFTMSIWASAFAGIRFMLGEISPMSLTVLRMVIAACTLLVVGLVGRIGLPRREDLGRLIAAALFGFTIYHLLLNLGTAHIKAGQASFIIATIPIWTSLLAARYLREKISARVIVGLAIGMAGVGFMSLSRGDANIGLGSLLVLLAAMCAAANMVLSKGLLERYRAIDFAVYATIAGCLPLLVYAPWAWAEVRLMSPTAWLVGLYLGIIPIGLGYWLSNVALAILPAGRAAQMLLLVPPMSALIAWLFIDEVPSTRLIVGGPLIMLGVLLGNVRANGRKSVKPLIASASE